MRENILSLDKKMKKLNNTGIYYAPELFISFTLGMNMKERSGDIFGSKDVEWLREINVGGGGPSDIVFKAKDGSFLIMEVKLRNKFYAYEADIKKLLRIQKERERSHLYFLVLPDNFGKDDERFTILENKYPLRLIGAESFWTSGVGLTVNDVYCNLKLYRIEEA